MRIRAVLTDLDGTLLEPDGRLGAEAQAALDELAGAGVPVLPVTSKTAAEVAWLLAQLGLAGAGGDGLAGGGIGRRDEQHPVEAPWSAQRQIHVPGRVGGRQN